MVNIPHGQKKEKKPEYIGLNVYIMYGIFTEEYVKKHIFIHLTDEIWSV